MVISTAFFPPEVSDMKQSQVNFVHWASIPACTWWSRAQHHLFWVPVISVQITFCPNTNLWGISTNGKAPKSTMNYYVKTRYKILFLQESCFSRNWLFLKASYYLYFASQRILFHCHGGKFCAELPQRVHHLVPVSGTLVSHMRQVAWSIKIPFSVGICDPRCFLII